MSKLWKKIKKPLIGGLGGFLTGGPAGAFMGALGGMGGGEQGGMPWGLMGGALGSGIFGARENRQNAGFAKFMPPGSVSGPMGGIDFNFDPATGRYNPSSTGFGNTDLFNNMINQGGAGMMNPGQTGFGGLSQFTQGAFGNKGIPVGTLNAVRNRGMNGTSAVQDPSTFGQMQSMMGPAFGGVGTGMARIAGGPERTDFSQIQQEQLKLLRDSSIPQEQQALSDEVSRLYSGGQLGLTGVADQSFSRLQDTFQRADLNRQLGSMGFADQMRQNALNRNLNRATSQAQFGQSAFNQTSMNMNNAGLAGQDMFANLLRSSESNALTAGQLRDSFGIAGMNAATNAANVHGNLNSQWLGNLLRGEQQGTNNSTAMANMFSQMFGAGQSGSTNAQNAFAQMFGMGNQMGSGMANAGANMAQLRMGQNPWSVASGALAGAATGIMNQRGPTKLSDLTTTVTG